MPIECEDCPGLPMPSKVAPPKAICSENPCSPKYERSAKVYHPPVKPKYKFFNEEDAKQIHPVKVYSKKEIEEYERKRKA
jgi:hypothetical protein